MPTSDQDIKLKLEEQETMKKTEKIGTNPSISSKIGGRQWTYNFEDISIGDIAHVGGKNASLGEMIQNLGHLGVSVPGGFAISSSAYRFYLEENKLVPTLRGILNGLDINELSNLREKGQQARDAILSHPLPLKLKEKIAIEYEKMSAQYGKGCVDVAVRSSATAEDLPQASFAGQQETYLHIHSTESLLESVLKCYASLFTDRAINYRVINKFDHFDVALSVGVQRMVRSDLASAGVIFTIDTETGFPNTVLVSGSYGLGELVVQGSINPDEWVVFKPTLKEGYQNPILSKKIGSKEFQMMYTNGTKLTKTVPVSIVDRKKLCLSDSEVLKLAKWAVIIEEHYSKKGSKFTPMDIEWAKDGETGELFIVQARPETVQSNISKTSMLKTYKLKPHAHQNPIVTGSSVGKMIANGRVSLVNNVSQISEFRDGDILVTNRTDPDWEPIMSKASGIITNQGGRTCHAAIISRELGIPSVVGTINGTEKIKHGSEITLDCSSGEVGNIYEGKIDYEINEMSIASIPVTKTKVMMNVGNPEGVFSLSFLPSSGVGLARLEFIIMNHIRVHPLALLKQNELKPKEKKEIEALLEKAGYSPTKYFAVDYFVDKLAQGVGQIAAAFYPKDVIVRFSDFKSNEYARLLGGESFEPSEENPMIGWRGASRYYDPKYEEAFALECAAFVKVRDEMGLKNVIPMVPFCRTPAEGRRVIETMEKYGLKRNPGHGEKDLQVYCMVEIPSNCLLIDEYCKIFDGFSIGSNDLTQLTLGLDRDSELVSGLFDERNDAVKKLIKKAIKGAKRNGKKIGICGQGPSDFEDFALFLVKNGIDSISLNPDCVVKTTLSIAKLEGEGEKCETGKE